MRRVECTGARLLAVSCAVLLVCVTASAEDDPYQRAITEGVAEFRRGNYDEAQALFRKAHKLDPNARTLRGMGMTAFEQRRYVEALGLLEQALAHQKKPLTGKQRAQISGLLERCRSFIARFELQLDPTDARLTVDSRPAVLEGDTLLLNPGEHEVVARAEGYMVLERRVLASGGETGRLALRLELEAASEGAAVKGEDRVEATEQPAGPFPPPEGVDPAAEPGSGGNRIWTWVAAGGAVVFAGTAGLFWTLANSEYAEAKERCEQIGCPTGQPVDQVVENTDLETFETLTTTSLILSGTALVAAGVLFFVEPGMTEDPDANDAPVSLGFGPGSVQLGVRF